MAALSRFRAVGARDGNGKGGKAQSRFVSSGEGGLRGMGNESLRIVGHGDLGPEVALTGDIIELVPLLAEASSP